MASNSTPSLNVDDMLMGEILMSLKRGNPAVSVPGVKLEHQSASYRNKMTGLSVQTSLPSSSPFGGSNLADVFDAASPMVYKRSPVDASSSKCFTVTPKGGSKRYGPVVQLGDLRECFNMPIAAVARKFGICATLLKKICRRHGIQRWPHRQIRSLQKSIDVLRGSLSMAKGTNREYITKKIAAFECTLECIMQDPNKAAKGISAGRLASPAMEEMVKRSHRAKSHPSKIRVALSDDEEGVMSPTDASSVMTTSMQQDWTAESGAQRLNTRRASLPMSLQSILC